ncbi:MAG TPA: MBL fold metallo-hydrolase [Gammaproteobacteria bacterium]
MRFALLGSGSRGNALLVEQGATTLMVDCGFTLRESERRLARLNKAPEAISAILVTHEHSDHIGGVALLARRYGIPVWMTPGTAANHDGGGYPALNLFNCHEPFAVGDIEITPFPVPHDAREPSQFVFGNGDRRLGLLTDVGRTTPHIEANLSGCHALVLETNHDPQMLANGPYPPMLQRRVGGDLGHLSNPQAAELLQRLDLAQLRALVGAHLSEKNNTPQLARQALCEALGCEAGWVGLADQAHGAPWRSLDGWL